MLSSLLLTSLVGGVANEVLLYMFILPKQQQSSTKQSLLLKSLSALMWTIKGYDFSYVSDKILASNSSDEDETPSYSAFHPDLNCLQT